MKIAWFILVLTFAPRLRADERMAIESKTQRAAIILDNADGMLNSETSQNHWQRFCQGLGQNLLSNNPSAGFLSSFSCQKPLSETEEGLGSWRIVFAEKAKYFDITLLFQSKNQWVKVQSFSFHIPGEFLESLQKASVQRFLARLILESLPTGWVYTHHGGSKTVDIMMHPDMPLLPEQLSVFQLTYDSDRNLWLPRLRAMLQRTDQYKNQDAGRAEIFALKHVFRPLVEGETYWIQNSKGRNQRQAEFEKKIAAEIGGFSLLNLLDRMLFESFTSNFAGIRYGRSFVQGDSVLTQTSLISALLELRSGPLAGLRWYYDLTPRAEKAVEDQTEYFMMSRTSLGWSMEFAAPPSLQGLLSRIDLQPKIGLLNLQSELSVQDSQGNRQLTEFTARRVLNLSLELGLEKETLGMRHRLWGSYSSSQAGIVNPDGISISSARLGFDAYIDLMKRQRWDLKILLFGFAETLSLTRDPDSIPEGSLLEIKNLGFNLFFLGGGLTVSW